MSKARMENPCQKIEGLKHIDEKGPYSSLIDEVDDFLQENMHFSNRRQFISLPAAVFKF